MSAHSFLAEEQTFRFRPTVAAAQTVAAEVRSGDSSRYNGLDEGVNRHVNGQWQGFLPSRHPSRDERPRPCGE